MTDNIRALCRWAMFFRPVRPTEAE